MLMDSLCVRSCSGTTASNLRGKVVNLRSQYLFVFLSRDDGNEKQRSKQISFSRTDPSTPVSTRHNLESRC